MSFFNDAQRDGLLTGRYICIMVWRMMKNMMLYIRPEIRSATTN